MTASTEHWLPRLYNIIDGRRAKAESTFDVINPATGDVLCKCPAATPAQVNEAVAAASAAFRKWRKVPLDEKKKAFATAAAILEANVPLLAKILTLEQGKPLAAAKEEIEDCVGMMKGSAEIELPHEVVKNENGERVEVWYRPIGVFACVCPWNYPAVIACGKIVDPLICGNTVVVKPSPFTPLTTLLIVDLIKDAFPPGVLNVLAGDNEIGAILTKHPDVGGVTFTGSVGTGKKIASVCADGVKRVCLELGGNDAAIVLDDCDVAKAADGIIKGAFMNSGQLCCAIKRLYVHESKYDELCTKLAAIAKAAKVGNGLEEGVQYGPINNKMQFERVKELLDDAVRHGGKVIAGGMPEASQKNFAFPLTLVTNVSEDVRLVHEEQFGPVLPILKYSDVDEVIERANNTKFGLGASVWGSDLKKACDVAHELEAGSVWVNQHAAFVEGVPFGGVKESGLGREGGKFGLASFLEAQAFVANPL